MFFLIPYKSIGKAFVHELSSQLQTFVDSGGAKAAVLYNFAILPTLMLQKPATACIYIEESGHLRRRMALWADQNFTALMDDGRCLQKVS